jgi:asparagine N-glycosylation enzyme membrane subunit Stt3
MSARFKLPLVLAGYLALAVAATYPLAFRAADHVFGAGTPPLNVWAIAWVNHQLPRSPLELFDGNVFYPYPRSLAFSEHLFVPSLLAAPFLAASGNPVFAHNAVALLTLALAGFFMYLLCRELTGDAPASFAAGALYAFHTWNVNELIRLQILSNQWFPLLLLALLCFFRQPRPRPRRSSGWPMSFRA